MPQGWTPVEEPKGWTLVEEKPAATASKRDGEEDEHGNRIVRNPDGSVKFIQGPGYRGELRARPDSNVATVGGVGIAPEDILAIPSMVKGGAALVRGVGKAASAARGPVASVLDVGAAALDNPITGTISPRAGQVGKLIGAAADFIRPAALPAVKAAEKAAPAVAEAVVPAAEVAVAPKAFNPNDALKVARDAFDKAGLKPLKAEVSNAFELIRRGKAPEEAVAIVVGNRPAGAVATVAEKVAPVVEKAPKLTAEEMKLGMDLMKRGKSPQDALDAVLTQRALRGLPGVESNATVASRVAQRNATGRWP